MASIIRKKIHQLGGAHAVIIPKWYMDKNQLKLNDEVELKVSDDYILIRDCRDPNLSGMLPFEMQALYELSQTLKGTAKR